MDQADPTVPTPVDLWSDPVAIATVLRSLRTDNALRASEAADSDSEVDCTPPSSATPELWRFFGSPRPADVPAAPAVRIEDTEPQFEFDDDGGYGYDADERGFEERRRERSAAVCGGVCEVSG